MATFPWNNRGPLLEKSDLESDESCASSDSSAFSPLLYTFLPSLVQRRISRLRSLRQALAEYDTRTRRHARISSQNSVESITPPPSYHLNLEEDSEEHGRSSSSSSSSRPSTSGSTIPAIPYHNETETETTSGVNWKYATTGISLLDLSSHESFAANTRSRNSNLMRRQYIDGVACVLRGLPQQLTIEEELCLREAMPGLRNYEQEDSADGKQGPSGHLSPHHEEAGLSTLHRCTAALTLYIFLAISFLTPYIQLFLQQAYAFDRQHRISEKAFAQGYIAADALGRQGMLLARNVCEWNEGKVGDVVREVGGYCVKGFGGGMIEGVGQGLKACGLREGRRVVDT